MAHVRREGVFRASIGSVYAVLTDYASYPKFVGGCRSVEILEMGENGGRVRFCIELFKRMEYVLRMEHRAGRGVSWEFESGDVFKVNRGSWSLEDRGDGATAFVYEVEAVPRGFLPGAETIMKKLTQVRLPLMIEEYEREAIKREGQK